MAAAKAFALEGGILMLAARRLDRLNAVAAICRTSGAVCEVMVSDIQEHDQVLHLVNKTIERLGRIDVLVNNAGMGSFAPFQDQSWDLINRTIRTNVDGPLALCHAVIPQMIKQGSGTIVNVSSVVGKRPVPMLAAYSASKFGLWGFSESLRLELRPHGIHVCHFCPTSTATEFQETAGIKSSSRALHGMDSADRVASAMVEAVIKRKREHIMSFTERLLIKFHLMMPASAEWLLNLMRRRGGSSVPTPNTRDI
jgi:short-subunit dehydrogenase